MVMRPSLTRIVSLSPSFRHACSTTALGMRTAWLLPHLTSCVGGAGTRFSNFPSKYLCIYISSRLFARVFNQLSACRVYYPFRAVLLRRSNRDHAHQDQ